MYRLEGIVDRVLFSTEECDKALEECDNIAKENEERLVLGPFNQITKSETQMKFHDFINDPQTTDEILAAIFRLIDKNIEQELNANEKGMSYHFLIIIMHNIKFSPKFWKKLIMIIGNPSKSNVLDDLNKILKLQSVEKCLLVVIEEYLNCLLELGEDFFIDVESVTDKKKRELFSSIEVPQMIIFIHNLLNLPTSQFIADKIFNTFELSPSFIKFLKLSLRNLNL